jgi:hypothetical protein
MKRLSYTCLVIMLLSACANAKKQEADLQKQVMDVHEKVMADDEKAMISKMKLDTIIHKADSLKTDKVIPTSLSGKLTVADDKMSDWMKNFNADNSGKNHDDVMKYLQSQLIEVKAIDSLLKSATTASNTYLQKTTIK